MPPKPTSDFPHIPSFMESVRARSKRVIEEFGFSPQDFNGSDQATLASIVFKLCDRILTLEDQIKEHK